MRLSIRYKILGTYLLVLLLFVALVVSSLDKRASIDTRLRLVEEGYIPILALTSGISHLYHLTDEFDLAKLRDNLRNRLFLESVHVAYPQMVHKNLAEIEKLLNGKLLRLNAVAESQGKRPDPQIAGILVSIHQVKSEHQRYQELITEEVRLSESPKHGATEFAARNTLLVAQRDRVRNSIGVLTSRLNRALQLEITAIGVLERKGAWLTIWLSVVGTFLVLGLSFLALFILRPIRELTLGAKLISEGDYSHRVRIAARDEVGTLASEFNKMAQSIAERNSALEELSHYNLNIIESMRSGLLVTDERGEVRSVNRALRRILGEGELPHAAELKQEARTVLQSGQPSVPRLMPIDVAGGKQRLVSVRHMPFSDARGRTIGVITLFDDVTEESLMRERLMQNEKLAAVGQLSAQVTHEIRNPLHAISLNLALLSEDLGKRVKKQTRELVSSIEKEIKRLNKVAQRYLQFSHPGKRQAEPTSLGAVADEVAYLLREELQQRHIALHLKLQDNNVQVMIDPDRFKQALVNLVRNAVEAVGESGGNIWINTLVEPQGVMLCVEDDGHGIPADKLPHIFDAFYTTKSKGTGLGLALTQKIVEEQQGAIGCRTRPEGGMLFWVRFPLYGGTVSHAADRNG